MFLYIFVIGIPIILIGVLGIQLMFIFECDYINLKIMMILFLLHMSGTALSILLSGNGSIVVKCLIFLVTVIVIYSSSIITKNYYKKLNKKQNP
jgi:hypothetical protein